MTLPQRPDHPDFWVLAAITQDLDEMVKHDHEGFEEAISLEVDSKTLAYVAFQRALRVVGAETRRDVVANMTEIAKLAAVYHEGFVAGARYDREKKAQAKL